MITRAHRFHGYSSLKYVYQNGQTVRASQVSLRYVLNERRKTWRVAIVVSRKVHKSAVIRNRIRRRIYEVVRMNQNLIIKPYDIVILVFSDQVMGLKPNQLNKVVMGLMHKAEITGTNKRAKQFEHDIVNGKEI